MLKYAEIKDTLSRKVDLTRLAGWSAAFHVLLERSLPMGI